MNAKENRMERALTAEQANRLARGKVRVPADPIDPSLWRIKDDKATEVHEPMTASAWLAFLKDWAR